jgi:predicted ester cyclase
LHGTHTGPLMDGTPPTGRTVAYPGASFVQVEGDKIRSEKVYVDRQTVAELLGLKAK